MRPYIKNKFYTIDTDESSDSFDTIEWLLKNINNHNGKVALWGTSYSGWETLMGVLDPHPALVCACPQAPPTDMWIYDDLHHNGAFRLMFSFNWLPLIDPNFSENLINLIEPYGIEDGYDLFKAFGTVNNITQTVLKNKSPLWDTVINHGHYDQYWRNRNILQHLENIDIPILLVAGWFDAEDFHGPIKAYQTIENNSINNKTKIIIGPWKHSGWNWMAGDILGKLNFGEKTAKYFRDSIEFSFFKFHLKNKGNFSMSDVQCFQTGDNKWKEFEYWPPKAIQIENLYLSQNQDLSFNPPNKNEQGTISYISDPNNPVPWSTEKRITQGHLWMVEDQRFVANREDVIIFQTVPIQKDLSIGGPIYVKLYFSSTGTDMDWIVKLIDVYPEKDDKEKTINNEIGGSQILLSADVFRSKYRNNFENPEPIIPYSIDSIRFNIGDKLHTFKKGHRIMIQIQNSWFPLIDRNPQQFMDIYKVNENDYKIEENTLYFKYPYLSKIEIPVLK